MQNPTVITDVTVFKVEEICGVCFIDKSSWWHRNLYKNNYVTGSVKTNQS